MVLGSVVGGNFWTYPFIFVGTYKLGKFFLGQTPRLNRMPEQFTWDFLLKKPMDYLWPMTLGSLPLCILSWTIAYYVAKHIMTRYRARRLAHLNRNKD
jgi:uncharacterized protein (DUF2062 family)